VSAFDTLRLEVEAAIAKAEAAMTPSSPPLPGVTTYGGGVLMHGLNNLRFGHTTAVRLVALRFRARYSLPLTEVRWYKEVGAGYSAGTGGTGRIWVYPDIMGRPDFGATPLASTMALAFGTGRQVGRLDIFTSASPLVAGTRYWLVWENTGTGTGDFVSLNTSHAWSDSDPVHPHKRWASPDDYEVYWGSRTAPVTIDSTQARWLPVHEITYSNGEHQGNSYMELGAQGSVPNYGLVQGSRRIRQRWTHHGPDVRVKGIGIAMQRASTSTAALNVDIKTTGGPVAMGTFSGDFPVGLVGPSDFRNQGSDYRRADLTPLTLTDGVTYDAEFYTGGNGHFATWPLRRGSAEYGYSGQSEWPDGRAQVFTTSWADSVHWGTRYDWNAYLERA
jgi:hypothetical protein